MIGCTFRQTGVKHVEILETVWIQRCVKKREGWILTVFLSGFAEGVQLLCLIDKAADACRYLQTYGEWNRAAWLAKVTQRDGVRPQQHGGSAMFGSFIQLFLPKWICERFLTTAERILVLLFFPAFTVCLPGKTGVYACSYIPAASWTSTWTACVWCVPFQVRLNPAEASDVLKRWAEQLCSPQFNQKSKAILLLLSLGCFYKVGEMLHRWETDISPTETLHIVWSIAARIHS